MIQQFVIAAPNSNAGKTTITLGLLRLFKNQGHNVKPFKVGPDYIDPKFHQLACKTTGTNLDLFMMEPGEIQASLTETTHAEQINCIEGVMGLFDGSKKAIGSTAELAKQIDTPVLLVIDAKAVAYSVAPLIQGFVNFDPDVKVMGVVFNRVGSARHYTMLQEACEDIGVKCFGYLSNLKDIEIPSRHLGLNIEDLEKFDLVIDKIASALEKTMDWQGILAASKTEPPIAPSPSQATDKTIKFAVAKDEAFNFIYPQNIAAMEALGTVTYFSPMRDEALPACDFAYFPGGYPECNLEQLAANTSMLQSIKQFGENGGQIYAECGGMMYLGKSIIDENDQAHALVNFFDFSSTIAPPKLHLGYRTSSIKATTFKGHEFHYSHLIDDQETPIQASVCTARAKESGTKIYHKNNVLASYVHHYFGSTELLLQLQTLITTHP